MTYSLKGSDGRWLTRNARLEDARGIAAKVNEATGETMTLTELASGEETVLFAAAETSWPKNHADLDAIADENDVEFPAKAKVAEKIEILEAAGVAAPDDDE